MKLKMAENSIFAVLLRSPWWISIAVAGGVFLLARWLLAKFSEIPDIYALFVPLPFVVIGVYAGWRQLRAPSEARIAARLEALRAMQWDEFSGAIEEAYRRAGYAVARIAGGPADFELEKAGRKSLLACKRWKAMRTGVEPLRGLHAAAQARDAQECLYVAAGEITDAARAFAAQKGVHLVHGAELATLMSTR
ncbi:MAG: restriction endonuclease [Betaproteobacteria bacterium]|nr:restriction endonuclease [Betaproteobacteria bacterium]